MRNIAELQVQELQVVRPPSLVRGQVGAIYAFIRFLEELDDAVLEVEAESRVHSQAQVLYLYWVANCFALAVAIDGLLGLLRHAKDVLHEHQGAVVGELGVA